MKTPIPAQVEHWMKIAENKKAPYDLRQNAILHLENIRDTINRSLRTTSTNNSNKQGFTKNENLFIR